MKLINNMLLFILPSLQLKEEAHEYTDSRHIKDLVNKYSQFINFDIFLWESKVYIHHKFY